MSLFSIEHDGHGVPQYHPATDADLAELGWSRTSDLTWAETEVDRLTRERDEAAQHASAYAVENARLTPPGHTYQGPCGHLWVKGEDGERCPCCAAMIERDEARDQRDALQALEGGWAAQQVADYLAMVTKDRQALEAERDEALARIEGAKVGLRVEMSLRQEAERERDEALATKGAWRADAAEAKRDLEDAREARDQARAAITRYIDASFAVMDGAEDAGAERVKAWNALGAVVHHPGH